MRYAKRGRLRFASHRDVARAFERAVRRAGVPIAYSQGFNPHPKLSWVGAAPTGAASEAEYVELGLVRQVPPDELRARLDRALPDGIDVLDVVPAGVGSLPERIDASAWRIELLGVDHGELCAAVDALLAAEHVEIERLTKSGTRTVDVRPAIVSVTVAQPSVESVQVSGSLMEPDRWRAGAVDGASPHRRSGCGILTAVVRQASPTVRPGDVLNALRVVAALQPPSTAKAVRLGQGRLDDAGHLVDPLAEDRAARSASGSVSFETS
ncbi:MAG: DUF2344 domain-containing protein, partial [Sciscionella sp.]|nr:DUF2344 domain-containing protein [Sciscionella sp.]